MKTEVLSLHSERRNGKNAAMICLLKEEGQYLAAGLHRFYSTGCECVHACTQEKEAAVFYTSDPNPKHETNKVLLINSHTFLTIVPRYAQPHRFLSDLGHFLV